ncbi:PREDICTED: dihydroflavonol 4-reductase [Tarenaya hassleriana]|uniref:dihydroflavonol 4-reductase n=1 Tax=Tarenaya hassleriana TaxID=28532 RepID=UPI00053CA287|nr:PREDICTED: dihydroflavonol 4-reductase [Tarenaya hassleriana]
MKREETATYCVTGASGYIGSWLVETLLQRGYTVHATLRDFEKSQHFLSKWTDNERIRLFRADLQEDGSFDEAVKGCDGVFHVAASMEFAFAPNQNIESYVQSKIIDPAIRGVQNVLGSCLVSKSVKRVVFTSSVSTLTAKDEIDGQWISTVDETCKTTIDHVNRTRASGWVYVLSKLISEEEAFKYAKKKGMDLVSVITTTVSGPFLTPCVPSSIQVMLSPITGDPKFFSILSAVKNRMGSIALVHIEDICNAHLFLMQHQKARGQYICCVGSCVMSQLIHHLSKGYPNFSKIQMVDEEGEKEEPTIPLISSKKLIDLGFEYKFGVEEIIHQTVHACMKHGFLPQTKSI